MTTPETMTSLIDEIRDRFQRAEQDHKESSKLAADSWGAGYDLGYRDALGELLEHMGVDVVALPSG